MKSFEKLKAKLAELFQLDQADLDFGIYRIMNARRDEITRFLDNDLLPQVREAFKEYRAADKGEMQKELDQVISGVRAAGMDPELSPKIKDLRARLATDAVDVIALENEVYDHLFNFFSRYYDEGDFISLRRYKEGVYAIPYEGEEVKLYWANHDQYYVKTTEYFRDYAFKTPDGSRTHFKIIEADTEKDNIKPANGKDRRFFLYGDKPVEEENGELIIRFEYLPDGEKRKQDQINLETVHRIIENLQTKPLAIWQHRLSTKWKRSDGTVSDRNILEKHLHDYTRRNTFDYFIHKDLGGFLRRELDFYIKNEVMRLDDVENESARRVEQYLSKIKVIRRIAHKLIDFLSQIEDFQKRLWLKKKFVIETQYCVTIDRILAIPNKKVREELLREITAKDEQREEWVRLYAIDEIKGDLVTPAYSKPLTSKFLEVNPHLVLDTKFFDQTFKDRLLASFEDIDESISGLLVQSENFQALNLLLEKNRAAANVVYTDPPYNTFATKIAYKNEYEHSSWLCLLESRLKLGKRFLTSTAITCTTIDDYEFHRLMFVMEHVFGSDNYLATIVIRNNPSGRSTVKGFSINHEYGLFFSHSSQNAIVGRMPHTEAQRSRYDQSDEDGNGFEWENFRKSSAGSYRADRPKQFFPIYYDPSPKSLRIPELQWQESSRTWKVVEDKATNEVAIWPKDSAGIERVWRYGIERTRNALSEAHVREKDGNFEIYTRKYLQKKGSLPRTWWDKREYSARDNGTRALADLFGSEKPFDFPKAPMAVMDSIRVSCCRLPQ